jgi:hypothetical protein
MKIDSKATSVRAEGTKYVAYFQWSQMGLMAKSHQQVRLPINLPET